MIGVITVGPVRERVAAALEVEGIVNDVTAAILAVATFELVMAPSGGIGVVLEAFASRLGLGIVLGASVGIGIYVLLQHTELSREDAPRDARLIVLVGALMAYGGAESILSEAGIAAAAVAGVVLGNLHPPYEGVITQFKGDVTLLVLSFVFITLAALLSFGDLLGLGIGGLAVVAIVVLVLRPVGVFLSTVGERFSRPERIFIGAIGPRGIVPASVATLFAIELQPTDATGASILVGTVFLVIFVTVVFQGGLARHIAQALTVIPTRVIVAGAGRVGRGLGARLLDRGEEVTLIDVDESVVEDARADGFRVIAGDATVAAVLNRAGIDNASVVAAAAGADDVNLLVAQLASTRHDVETVIARVNQPENREAFEELGVRTISTGEAVAASMDNAIERPTITHWMTDMDRTGDVQEVELRTPEFDGATVGDLVDALPGEYVVPVVGREGETIVPGGRFELRLGDSITIIGEDREAVHRAMERCRGE
jgi:NhaP-type Na+/H+ or K+/H+ antiporter